jgi:PHD-zinc-finger like domain/PHD-finger/Enhancer of polycomb-like
MLRPRPIPIEQTLQFEIATTCYHADGDRSALQHCNNCIEKEAREAALSPMQGSVSRRAMMNSQQLQKSSSSSSLLKEKERASDDAELEIERAQTWVTEVPPAYLDKVVKSSSSSSSSSHVETVAFHGDNVSTPSFRLVSSLQNDGDDDDEISARNRDRRKASDGIQQRSTLATPRWRRPSRYIRYNGVIGVATAESDYGRLEYDLDSDDELFLANVRHCFGGEAVGRAGLDESALERLIDCLEKFTFESRGARDIDQCLRIPKWMLSSDHMSYSRLVADADMSVDDIPCSVCNDGRDDAANQVVFCDGCDIAVHQLCYGIEVVPPGDERWLCTRCAASETRARCSLCSSPGGAMKRTVEGLWAHVTCALWIPETCFLSIRRMEPIANAPAISRHRRQQTCHLCRRHVGACIKCTHASCCKYFHVTCARQRGLFVELQRVARQSIDALAASHRQQQQQQQRQAQEKPHLAPPTPPRLDAAAEPLSSLSPPTTPPAPPTASSTPTSSPPPTGSHSPMSSSLTTALIRSQSSVRKERNDDGKEKACSDDDDDDDDENDETDDDYGVRYAAYCCRHSMLHWMERQQKLWQQHDDETSQQQQPATTSLIRSVTPKEVRDAPASLQFSKWGVPATSYLAQQMASLPVYLIEAIYNYWVLRRRARGEPLLRRLQVVARDEMSENQGASRRRGVAASNAPNLTRAVAGNVHLLATEYANLITVRRQLEGARLLIDLSWKRERLKRARVQIMREQFEQSQL